MKDLIGSRERILFKSEATITDTFARLDKGLLRKLLEFLNTLDTEGDNVRFSSRNADLLIKFRNDIEEYLRSNIGENEILQSIRKLTDSNAALAREITGRALNVPTLTAIQDTFGNIVVERVSGAAGILKNDLASTLFRHIGLGTTKSGVVEEVKSFLEGTEASRYARQIATDSIFQYDGMVQKHLTDKLNLDAFMFVGSLIETSREGCIHMVNAPKPVEICKGKGENRKCVTRENRFKDIFLPSGGFLVDDIPFIIEMNQNDSGWNPDTTPENYLSLRNGFNCRHQTVVYKSGRDEVRVNKLLEVYEN